MNTMVATDNQPAGELERHREAYLLLFESLLKKRISDGTELQARLTELQKIVDEIQETDGFIDRLSDFGRILQVRDDQLGSYIGQNFLKALAIVRDRQRQAPRKNPSSDVFSQDGPIIETLLSIYGPIVAPPDRFEGMDNGAVKLIRSGREILPASVINTAQDAGDFASASSPVLSAVPAAETASLAGTDSASDAVKLREEKSILAEILERFGNILDIPGVLTPRDFTGEDEGFSVEEVAAPEEPAAAGVEPSIIEEILQRFGNDLVVKDKLEPRDFSENTGDLFDSADSADSLSMNDEGQDFQPIAVTLSTFANIRSRLAEFHKNQDRAGYQEYLNTATDDMRAVVAVCNLAAKAKRQQIDMGEELYRLSLTLPYTQEQLQELYERLDRYSKTAALINEFTARVKQASAPLQMEVRKVWKQILDLLDEDPGEAVVKQRMKILLLAVNPAVKPKIESAIMSLINRIYSL